MQAAPIRPRLHLFVCSNRRSEDHALGPGCGARGEGVFAHLKARVASEREYQRVWVTQTSCIGVCPRVGATVAVYPQGQLHTEVGAEDADSLYDEAVAAMKRAATSR